MVKKIFKNATSRDNKIYTGILFALPILMYTVQDALHSLVMSKLTLKQFGNYSCNAENIYGKAEANILLTGERATVRNFCSIYLLLHKHEINVKAHLGDKKIIIL